MKFATNVICFENTKCLITSFPFYFNDFAFKHIYSSYTKHALKKCTNKMNPLQRQR